MRGTPEERIAELEAEVARLEKQVARLDALNDELIEKYDARCDELEVALQDNGIEVYDLLQHTIDHLASYAPLGTEIRFSLNDIREIIDAGPMPCNVQLSMWEKN